MNIESNTLSRLPGSQLVGSDTGTLSGKTSVENEFANAFNDQIKRSQTTPVQAEMPQRNPIELRQAQPSSDNTVLQTKLSSDNMLTTLLGNKSLSTNNVDKETEQQAQLPEDLSDTSQNQLNNSMTVSGDLSFLANTAKPTVLSENILETKNEQNSSNVVVFNNSLPLTVPPTTTAPHQDTPAADFSLDDILPSHSFLSEPAKETQEIALPTTDSIEPTEKSTASDQLSMPEPKNVPSGTNQLQQPNDVKTEMPTLSKPINHPGWSKDLGEQIVWLYNKTIPSAEITLNPEHLGPISVRIDIDQDQASIQFTTQHASVKEVLEASIPKLREMLGTQQLNLVDVNVSQQSSSNQQQSPPQNFANPTEQREQNSEGVADVIERTENGQMVAVNSLLSLYA